jgi:dolichol-phosphate mannosyltransferase
VSGCAATLDEVHHRLTATLHDLVDSYQIVLVDDRGPDDPWPALTHLAANDANIVALRLSHNVGQPLAIAAGLLHSCGDRAVVMDCDLQDPPEGIPTLYARAQNGAEIVLERKGVHQSNARNLANRVYVAILNFLIGQRYDRELGSFSLVSRAAIERFLALPQRGGPYPLVLLRLGMPTAMIDVERRPRALGRSSFGVLRLISYGLAGLVFAVAERLLPRHDLATLVERGIGSDNGV